MKKSGFDPIPVRTGRDVLRRLNKAADVDLVLIDEALPDPGLPSLLAQLRADLNYGRIPVVVTVPKEREDALRRYVATVAQCFGVAAAAGRECAGFEAVSRGPARRGRAAVVEAELKEYAEKAVHHLAELAKGQPPGIDVRPAAETVFAALRSGGLSPEGQIDADPRRRSIARRQAAKRIDRRGVG